MKISNDKKNMRRKFYNPRNVFKHPTCATCGHVLVEPFRCPLGTEHPTTDRNPE